MLPATMTADFASRCGYNRFESTIAGQSNAQISLEQCVNHEVRKEREDHEENPSSTLFPAFAAFAVNQRSRTMLATASYRSPSVDRNVARSSTCSATNEPG